MQTLPPPVMPAAARRRGEPRRKTHGVCVDEVGRRSGMVSGQDEAADRAHRVIHELKLIDARTRLTIAWHVEMKLAAMMRLEDWSRRTLVLNNVPCPGRYGCRSLVPQVLRPGQTLTIHYPGGTMILKGRRP